MNASQFMDKQIMDLSAGSRSDNFINLMSPDDDHLTGGGSGGGGGGGGSKKEEILASYDFQPIRPTGSSQLSNLDSIGGAGGPRAWNADSKSNAAGTRNYGSLDSNELSKILLEKDQNIEAAIVSEIDRTMKKHADNLLHALEGLSARLTQLESRTRNLENSVDDLKVSVGNNYGTTDGKMRQLENILREVHTGVQVLREKQDIVEAQLHLAKLQVSKADQQSETQNTVKSDSAPQASSLPQQSHQQLLPPPVPPLPQTLPALLPPNAPPPPPQLNMPSPPPQLNMPSPPPQRPDQFPPNQVPSIPQREPYFQPPGQAQEAPSQQYQPPPSQPQPPPPAAQSHQQYQPASLPQYSQLPQLPQRHPSVAPMNPPPQHNHPEEASYVPPQTYPPSFRQPPSQPPSAAPAHQQFYGFSTGFAPPSGPSEPFSYSGSPSQYGGNLPMKPQQLSSDGGSGYPQLPAARVLPHALPTASVPVGGSGSGSSGSGNRVPIDDVVDKVTNMGFPRDHVRATVRKLTENGQSVDLNVVLDKLMNDGEVQPPRGWYGH